MIQVDDSICINKEKFLVLSKKDILCGKYNLIKINAFRQKSNSIYQLWFNKDDNITNKSLMLKKCQSDGVNTTVLKANLPSKLDFTYGNILILDRKHYKNNYILLDFLNIINPKYYGLYFV